MNQPIRLQAGINRSIRHSHRNHDDDRHGTGVDRGKLVGHHGLDRNLSCSRRMLVLEQHSMLALVRHSKLEQEQHSKLVLVQHNRRSFELVLVHSHRSSELEQP
ncbi:MAG: hypothetical protein AB8G99_18415 [Planctomycetaceae bacterium]